ncbi:hypothetical protein [Caldalkalibacillus mannanilyticus]|uniref:hypothetical protein n=1 Tax=Caldalkalibacillus mannanilyticus TaxID=1418 RepID=UPI00046A2CC2|nr:hypothetical protein [Caldalkalibacillus mannanilyticus]
MRKLTFPDVFKVSRILKKMKIRPEILEDSSQESVGLDIIMKFLENLGDAEEEVTAFLADLKEMSMEEFKQLDLEQTAEVIKEFSEIPGLQSFLKVVSKSMK